MRTIILPGYSAHNRDWAFETKEKLIGFDVSVHEWEHWSKDVNFSAKREIERIIKEIGDEKVNILAKSVGVATALELIPKIHSRINYVILCGIASVVNEDRKDLLEQVTKLIPVERILCIQNENDKFVPYPDAEKFYHSVDPGIKVISKPRNDHEYPYSEDFMNFLRPEN